MSAAVSSTSADPSRRLSSRYQVGAGQPELTHGGIGQDAAGLQAGLFEQILSLPVPIETDFHPSADDWASQTYSPPQPADAKSENDDREELQADEPASSAESDDLAASVAAIDQTAVAIDPGDEPSAENVELTLQANEEPDAQELQSTQAADLPGDDATQDAVTLQTNSEQSEQLVGDEASTGEQVAEDASANVGTELLEDSITSDAAAKQSKDEQLDADARQSVEDPGDDVRIAAEGDGQDETDKAFDAETAVAVSPTDDVGEDGGNRNSRDRREKWFEKDAAEQADAARADEIQKPDNDEQGAAVKEVETQESNLPTTAATSSDEVSDEVGLQDLELSTPNIAPSREPLSLPAGMTATDAEPTDRGSLNVSGLGRGTERARPATSPPGTKANAPGDSVDLTQQERVRLVQRVARSFARIGPEGGQINLRLHPPQLGSLNVQVKLEGRSMTANLTTESGAARDAILESLPVLRSRLAEQGFEISQFQVDVASNGSDASQSGGENPTLDQGSRDRESQVDYRRLARSNNRLDQAEQQGVSTQAESLVWQTHTGIDVQA